MPASPNWRGATVEEINEFLLKYVPPARVDSCIKGKPPRNRESIQRKLREAGKNKRQVVVTFAIWLPLLGGWLVWMAIEGDVIKAAVMGGLMLLSVVPLYVFTYLSQQKQVNELKDALNALDDSEAAVPLNSDFRDVE